MTNNQTRNDELPVLQVALEHASAWVELHANQRQNFLNFFLIAAAFLFNAYVGAITDHRRLLGALIALVGVVISVGFTAMDLRNRDLTRAGEAAMRDIENKIADKYDLPTFRIIAAIDTPRHPWMSIGQIIRSIHLAVAAIFIVATVYAFVA